MGPGSTHHVFSEIISIAIVFETDGPCDDLDVHLHELVRVRSKVAERPPAGRAHIVVGVGVGPARTKVLHRLHRFCLLDSTVQLETRPQRSQSSESNMNSQTVCMVRNLFSYTRYSTGSENPTRNMFVLTLIKKCVRVKTTEWKVIGGKSCA